MRSIAYVLVTLLLSAALTAVLTSIPPQVADAAPDVISNSSTILPPPDEARVEAPKPIEMPADVVSRAETSSSEVALWRTGAPLAVILAALAGALIFVAHFDGKRALKWTSLAAAVLVAADAAHGGEAPTVSMLISAIAVLGGISLPGVLQQRLVVREHPRAPTERGAGAGSLLVILATVGIVWGAGMLLSCSAARQRARDAAGACSLATVISRAMAVPEPQGLLATPGPSRAERMRAAWEAVRAERFGGARFRVEGGTL